MLSASITGESRWVVVGSNEVSPSSARNCLGNCWRDSGHKRLPLPPARMTAWTLLMGALQQSLLLRFALQFIDLCAQPLVFLHLDLQKLHRHARFLFDSFRGEQIGIGQLVVAVAEIIDRQAAFFDQRVDAEIDLAKADTQAFCQISLGK